MQQSPADWIAYHEAGNAVFEAGRTSRQCISPMR